MTSKRFAIAGTGIRALGFAKALERTAPGRAELVGLLDLNRQRMKGFCDLLGRQVPSFTRLEALQAETSPDTLIVCTPDHTHAAVIEAAFAAGLDVVTEKPMATDEDGVRRILAAEHRARRPLRVAFNLRYMPLNQKVKSLLASGAIGRVRHVSADWFVDRTHGIEYFRRWHAHMAQSGGLLVHKSTHHFDLLNWFIGARPRRVTASGSLEVFGEAGRFRGERCRGCEHADRCWAAMPQDALDPNRMDLDESWTHLRKLYFDAEAEDGYIRDRCVFRPDIDIYDTMGALIGYDDGTQVTYSLTAYAPYQGFSVIFNGTAGRMEVKSVSGATRAPGMGDQETIRIITGTTRQDIAMRIEDMPVNTTAHGGADEPMMREMFGDEAGGSDLGQRAGAAEGADSALIGICANRSIREGRMIDVPDLVAQVRGAASATAASA